MEEYIGTKFKKKPVIIEAVRWDGNRVSKVTNWISKALEENVIIRYGNEVKISTLEGIMTACAGDYIIKGVNGEIYPCKPDIFNKTYDVVKEDGNNMNFGDAIEILKQGGAIRRTNWNGKGLFVIKQVPAHIESDIIPKMQSLPQSAKDLILKGKGFIDYTSQCLIYNENTGRADSWVPSIADVFADDWEIVL